MNAAQLPCLLRRSKKTRSGEYGRCLVVSSSRCSFQIILRRSRSPFPFRRGSGVHRACGASGARRGRGRGVKVSGWQLRSLAFLELGRGGRRPGGGRNDLFEPGEDFVATALGELIHEPVGRRRERIGKQKLFRRQRVSTASARV